MLALADSLVVVHTDAESEGVVVSHTLVLRELDVHALADSERVPLPHEDAVGVVTIVVGCALELTEPHGERLTDADAHSLGLEDVDLLTLSEDDSVPLMLAETDVLPALETLAAAAVPMHTPAPSQVPSDNVPAVVLHALPAGVDVHVVV